VSLEKYDCYLGKIYIFCRMGSVCVSKRWAM